MNARNPFACDMTALSSEQRARHRELEQSLRSALTAVRELPNGFEFEFHLNPENYRGLAELTPLEHACCPFFDIGIGLTHNDKLLWRLTGTEGVKLFIRREFEPWFAGR